MNRISDFLSIKQGEARMAALVIGVMLLTAFGQALGGTGIEALFLDYYGAAELPHVLPYMYIGLGITSMLTSFGITSVLGRVRREVLYSAMPLVVAAVLILARLAVITEAGWLYPTLWLGKEVANSLITMVVWGISGAVCDTRQAKRLFPLFNASRILGQVIAGFSTQSLVNMIGTANLLIIWTAVLLTAFIVTRLLLSHQKPLAAPQKRSRRKNPSLGEELQRGYQYVHTSQLMRWVSLAAILFSVLYFSIYLPFQTNMADRFKDADSIASFLGLFNGLNTAAAFLVSLLLANRIFSRIGIMACILAMPIIYFIGFGSITLFPLFVIIAAFRFVQMLWLSGIADPAYQAMFNVVPSERRDQVRTFVDGVPGQAGTFISGAILLIGEQALAPQQLYVVGLLTAALCTFAIWRARQGYNQTLIEALRAGQPHLFYSEEQPFGGFKQDSSAINAALKSMTHPDATIRRVAAEILGHLSVPEATPALIKALTDPDTHVRATSIRALAESNASIAFNDIVTTLHDPDSDVRVEAIMALTRLTNPSSNSSMVFSILLPPLLDDPDSRVSTRAAVTLLKIPSRSNVKAMLQGNTAPKSGTHAKAMQFLRQTAILGELSERLDAIEALGQWKDLEAVKLLQSELEDLGAPAAIRRAALTAITRADSANAIPRLLTTLGDDDPAVRNKAAEILGEMDTAMLSPVIEALFDEARQDGALATLQHWQDLPAEQIEAFAGMTQARALRYHALRQTLPNDNEQQKLLRDTLLRIARTEGLRVFQAISLIGERESLSMAIEELQKPNGNATTNALETVDALTLRWRVIVQPALKLWDEDSLPADGDATATFETLLDDPSPWLRACTAYAARHSAVDSLAPKLDQLAQSDPDALVRDAAAPGDNDMTTINTLSIMDRILFLKKVPLFDNLSPADLKQVAFTATEEVFPAGEALAYEGDPGDTMFVIVSGEVRVAKGKEDVELARRKPNEYVGEMAIITNAPRNASLIAASDVRVLALSQKNFLGLLRDRPDVSLSIIRTLSGRLEELNQKIEALSHA